MNIRWAALIAGLALLGGAAVWVLRDDPHTASPELLTGTVIWSNSETQLVAFEQDGVPRDPLRGDTIYNVITSPDNLPACLVTTGETRVREDHRRVELNAIHADFGGPQKVHVALELRCLAG
jgi:hypothetical protein